MQRILNKNNFKQLLNAIDIRSSNQTKSAISKIFFMAVNIVLNDVMQSGVNNSSNQSSSGQINSKGSLLREIESISNSDREILTLLLHKIIHQENFNVAPIEWLTAESLLNLLRFSSDAIFPISGKNLFYRWCYVHNHNLKDQIKNIKDQINLISLPAKILIYNEVVKWKTSEYKDYNFDLFLSFLSFLHEEEITKILLEEKEVV